MLHVDSMKRVSIVAFDGEVAWEVGCVGSDDGKNGWLSLR